MWKTVTLTCRTSRSKEIGCLVVEILVEGGAEGWKNAGKLIFGATRTYGSSTMLRGCQKYHIAS